MEKQASVKQRLFLFLFGQSISVFGSSLVQFALMWYVTRTTDSGMMIAISTIVSFVPSIISSLYGGVIADRYDRKKIMMISDGMIALSTLILAILLSSGFESLSFIFIVSAIRSFGSGIHSPAISAFIPELVPEDQLMRVNGLHGSISSLIYLVAPAAAAGILSWGPLSSLLYIDVITAIIGIGFLALIRVKSHVKTASEKPQLLKELKEGIGYTRSHPFLKRLIRFFALFSIVAIPPIYLNVLMVTRSFGDDYFLLSLNEISFFVGATLGGILIAQWGGFKNRIYTLVLGTFVFGLTTLLMGITAELVLFIPYLIIMAFCGISMPAFNSPVHVLIQEKVSSDYLGRVFSIVQLINSAIMPLGMLVFGPLADWIPITWLMIFSGAAQMLMCLAMIKDRHFVEDGVRLPAAEAEIA